MRHSPGMPSSLLAQPLGTSQQPFVRTEAEGGTQAETGCAAARPFGGKLAHSSDHSSLNLLIPTHPQIEDIF